MRTSIDYAALERSEKPLSKSWTWDAAANVWRKTCTAKRHVDERVLPLERFGRQGNKRDGLCYCCKICNGIEYREQRARAKGFDNLTEYKKSRAIANGFKNYTEYAKYIAIKNGFTSHGDYVRHRLLAKGFAGFSEYAESRAIANGFNGFADYRKHLLSKNGHTGFGSYANTLAQRLGFKNSYERNREILVKQSEQRASVPFQENFAEALRDDRAAFRQLFGDACPACGLVNDFSHDHLVAITLGGIHHALNSLHICRSCNTSKFVTDPLTWLDNVRAPTALREFVEDRLIALFCEDGLLEMHEAAFAALDDRYQPAAAAWFSTWAAFVETKLHAEVTES